MKTIETQPHLVKSFDDERDNLGSQRQNIPEDSVLPHIFITGKAGHGKDSIGDHLIARFDFEKMSFSDGIREEITSAYAGPLSSVTNEWQNLREIKEISQARLALVHCRDKDFVSIALNEFKKEDKELFTRLKSDGSKVGADAYESFSDSTRMMLPRSPRRIQQLWGTEYRRSQNEDYWLDFAKKNADFNCPQVLTSVRYASELEFGVQIGAVRIHVERPGVSNAHNHITEETLPMDTKTIVISNTGSLAELHTKVNSIMARLIIESADHKNENVKLPKARP